MTTIAREFIRRASDVIEGDEFEAEDWDGAIKCACIEAIAPYFICLTPPRVRSRGERRRIEAVERTYLDYHHTENAYSFHHISPTDYGRGTVALIVRHAEEDRVR